MTAHFATGHEKNDSQSRTPNPNKEFGLRFFFSAPDSQGTEAC
jgi:hypothetical protein